MALSQEAQRLIDTMSEAAYDGGLGTSEFDETEFERAKDMLIAYLQTVEAERNKYKSMFVARGRA